MIYEKEKYVAGSMCDASVKMSVIAAFEIVEDSVTELLGSMHIDGVTAMKKYGAMWVFSKNVMRFYRKPEWLEKLRISCFISGHSKLRMFCDTVISSEAGEKLVSSRVEICGIDLKEGRIRPPETVGFTEDMEHPCPAEDLAFGRFGKEALPVSEEVRVRSTNIDYCSHTNNIEYVRFILNSYPSEKVCSDDIAGIELHYLGQTHEGDLLSIESELTGSLDRFNVRSEGKAVIACRIEWRNEQ
ncbi:MAG: acyl-ACP thioesterase [Ruminococcus sp.]|nr:acyl-ACP thioesterase [Ruminococcus sp.]